MVKFNVSYNDWSLQTVFKDGKIFEFIEEVRDIVLIDEEPREDEEGNYHNWNHCHSHFSCREDSWQEESVGNASEIGHIVDKNYKKEGNSNKNKEY